MHDDSILKTNIIKLSNAAVMKIGIIFLNFGPYHFSRLQACLNLDGLHVSGVELSREDDVYLWSKLLSEKYNIDLTTLFPDKHPSKISLISLVLVTFLKLGRLNCDALAIAGYHHPMMLTAAFWCACFRKPAILMCESKEDDSPRSFWKEALKALILRLYRVALVGGSPHKRYLEKLGMPSERIFTGYDVVGNDTFAPAKIRHLPHPVSKPYFLSINRFVSKKNLPNLLAAYAAYRQTTGASAWDLVLCGDGELRATIEAQIHQLGLTEQIHLPGFLQQDKLLPYFAHAGCFVHASIQEQWGLVVNEAMAAGLPVLVSRTCGCFEDLVIEGVNGFGFDPANVADLSELMSKMASGNIDRKAMGEASLQHIQHYSPMRFAHGLSQAAQHSLAFSQRIPSE